MPLAQQDDGGIASLADEMIDVNHRNCTVDCPASDAPGFAKHDSDVNMVERSAEEEAGSGEGDGPHYSGGTTELPFPPSPGHV